MSGWVAGAIAVTGLYSANKASKSVERASGKASDSALQAAREARELNIERYGEAKELMAPYLEQAGTAQNQLMVEMGMAPGEAGAYMTPGYESLLDERQRGVEQASASSGSLYSGARMKAAGDVSGATQSQFYNNYMSILQGMASPGVATNLASLGMGQAAMLGQQQMQAQQTASGYMVGAAQGNQAFTGDLIGGAANLYGGYLAGGGGGGIPPDPPRVVSGDAYQPAYESGYI